MSLVLTKKENETWRDAVKRYGAAQGMDDVCLDEFDAEIKRGVAADLAAWSALYEWDCLDFKDDDAPTTERGQDR